MNLLIILVVILLLFGGGLGYYGHSNWGGYAGPGIGLGTLLIVVLVIFLLMGRI